MQIKPFKLAKWLLLSGMILLVASFGLKFFAGSNGNPEVSSSSADTINWQSYDNSNLGISLKYPKDWSHGVLAKDDWILNLLKDNNQVTIRIIENFESIPEIAILQDVVFDGSGKQPKSINEFTKVKIGDYEYYKIQTGRFEGVLSYNYYLPVKNKIFVFSFTAQGVDWTNPNLDEENVPTHLILKQILSTVKMR